MPHPESPVAQAVSLYLRLCERLPDGCEIDLCQRRNEHTITVRLIGTDGQKHALGLTTDHSTAFDGWVEYHAERILRLVREKQGGMPAHVDWPPR